MGLELQLEYIRNIYYKNLPSRLQSIFAFDEFENALQFKKNNGNYGAIYEIDFSGCFFRADMNWLKFDFDPSIQKQYAMQYWEGKAFSTEKTYEPKWEIVIELPVTIKREIAE